MNTGEFHTKSYAPDAFPLTEYLDLLQQIYTQEVLASKQKEIPHISYQGKTVVMFYKDIPVACATLFCDQNIIQDSQVVAFIGFFESLDVDCTLLFNTLEELAASSGINRIIGPVNGSTWESYRFTEPSSLPLFPGEPMHPAYYLKIWEENKYKVHAKFYSFIDQEAETNEDELKLLKEKFSKEGITFRSINMMDFENELDKLYSFCLLAFKNNYLYSPISKERFKEKYVAIRPLIDPRFLLFAENHLKELVGFIFCFPNINNPEKKELIVKTFARFPDVQYKGMGLLLAFHFMKNATLYGYNSIIHAFVHENNQSKNVSSQFNGEFLRTYLLYSKML